MKKITQSLISVPLAALLVDINAGHHTAVGGETHEPIRIAVPSTNATSGFMQYNITKTAEDLIKPLKIIGEAPTPDLNAKNGEVNTAHGVWLPPRRS